MRATSLIEAILVSCWLLRPGSAGVGEINCSWIVRQANLAGKEIVVFCNRLQQLQIFTPEAGIPECADQSLRILPLSKLVCLLAPESKGEILTNL